MRQNVHTIFLASYFNFLIHFLIAIDMFRQFFGIIRQTGCQNDHPTLPTFLYPYKRYIYFRPWLRTSHVVDYTIYYVRSFFCWKLIEISQFDICKSPVTSTKTYSYFSQAELVNNKTRGKVIHANINSYSFLHAIGTVFTRHIKAGRRDIYKATISDVVDNYKFSFLCEFHKAEIISYWLHYYTTMRMRQWTKDKIESQGTLKQCREKKKLANQMKNWICEAYSFFLNLLFNVYTCINVHIFSQRFLL